MKIPVVKSNLSPLVLKLSTSKTSFGSQVVRMSNSQLYLKCNCVTHYHMVKGIVIPLSSFFFFFFFLYPRCTRLQQALIGAHGHARQQWIKIKQ